MASCFRSCSKGIHLDEVKALYIIPWGLIKYWNLHNLFLYIYIKLFTLSGSFVGWNGVGGYWII